MNFNSKLNIPFPQSNVPWTIYGVSGCSYTRKAVEHLNQKYRNKKWGIYHDMEKIAGRGNKHLVYNHLAPYTNSYNTVPIIFYYGKFIGGYNEMIRMLP